MKVKLSEVPNNGLQYYWTSQLAEETARSKQFETQFRELVTSMKVSELEWFSAMSAIKMFASENKMDPTQVEKALVAINMSANPQLAFDDETLVDFVIKGETIELWDFRDSQMKTAVATADEILDDEGDREVAIQIPGYGEHHYAIWQNDRWESGDF